MEQSADLRSEPAPVREKKENSGERNEGVVELVEDAQIWNKIMCCQFGAT